MDQQELNFNSILVNDIESVKAQYINKDFLIEPAYYNYRVNVKGERFYARLMPDNNIITAPSFSAIRKKCSPMPKYLLKWYVDNGWDYCNWFLENSANYGTIFHILAGYLTKGGSLSTNLDDIYPYMEVIADKEGIDWKECLDWIKKEGRDVRKDIFGWCKFCQDYKLVPIAIEYPVMHPRGRWAGTIDLIAKITIKDKEYIVMIDLKSGLNGFYEDHEIQLHAYKPLWDMEWYEFKIDMACNYGCHDFRIPLSSKVIPYKFKDQTDSESAWKWKYWVAMYHKGNKIKFDKKIDFSFNKEFSLESNLDEIFVEEDPLEYLKNQEAF